MDARSIAHLITNKLSPGTQLDLDRDTLCEIYSQPGWSIEDWVMEHIIGGSYEFGYVISPDRSGCVTFFRLPKPLEGGLRTYVSPDRREHFTLRPDGFFEPKPTGKATKSNSTCVSNLPV